MDVNATVLPACFVKELLASTRRAALCAGEFGSIVKYKVENNVLTVSSNSQNMDFTDEIPVEYGGEAFEANFKPQYIIDVLKNIAADKVTFAFVNASQPVLIPRVTLLTDAEGINKLSYSPLTSDSASVDALPLTLRASHTIRSLGDRADASRTNFLDPSKPIRDLVVKACQQETLQAPGGALLNLNNMLDKFFYFLLKVLPGLH